MTKQEQIEEMANYYCEYCKRQTGEKFCEHIDDKSCNIFFEAELFYNAGYRKAEEVRKETAKEILQKFHDWIGADFEENEDCDFIPILKKDFFRRVDEISKEYGVEVEE